MTIINGVVFPEGISGGNVHIGDGKIIIDGVEVKMPDEKIITVELHGNPNSLQVASCKSIVIHGSCGDVKTTNGDITCKDVSGSITTINGDVDCQNVGGSVSTVNGKIKHQ